MSLLGSILENFFNGKYEDMGCDWYCDECNAYLNAQPGFTTINNDWTCTECGHVNGTTYDNIVNYEYDNEDKEYDEERLSVWDAAEIWRSRGRDEDYMFGYTEEELENA